MADRYGRTFNGYANLLNLRHGSLLTPDIGGAALTSRLTVIDLVGLAEPTIANYSSAGDMTGLRDHIFARVKPTFLHVHGHWAVQIELPSDARLARDYALVYQDAHEPLNQD